MTQSQKDYKNFINIDNENNSIKDFYEGYYHVLSWITIIYSLLAFIVTMWIFKFNKKAAGRVVGVYMPGMDVDKWITRFQIIFGVFDAIIIFIGELIMFLKTLRT